MVVFGEIQILPFCFFRWRFWPLCLMNSTALILPLYLSNEDETELCQSSTSLSNISPVFLREKLVWRNEVRGRVQYPQRHWIVTIYFCICFLFPGYALRCNQCVSLKIWDECKSTMKQVTCLDSQDRCVNADIRNESSRVFAKGCSNSSVCDAKNCKSIYPSAKIIKCRIDCCKGDLCNGAKVSMVSTIMLLACAIAAFAR